MPWWCEFVSFWSDECGGREVAQKPANQRRAAAALSAGGATTLSSTQRVVRHVKRKEGRIGTAIAVHPTSIPPLVVAWVWEWISFVNFPRHRVRVHPPVIHVDCMHV